MPGPAIAVAGLGLGSAAMQASAAKKAGNQQAASAQAGIDEQRRQFDTIRELLNPYVNAGGKGLESQLGLMGLNGPEAQQAAIDAISAGPEMGALVSQGENAILQNASATGGLRGGNTQGALAQFRPQVLSALINQQMQRFGGLAAMGQNSAAGVGTAAQVTGNNVTELLAQQGAAAAGSSLMRGQAWGNALGGISGMIGQRFLWNEGGGAGGTGSLGLPDPFGGF